LGKSLVGGQPTDDVFAGITPGPIPFAAPSRQPHAQSNAVSLEAGGPWDFYRQLWNAHHLDIVAHLLAVPEFTVRPGKTVDIPLIIRNETGTPQTIALSAVLPKGWSENRKYTEFPLPPQSTYSLHTELTVPATVQTGWYEVEWTAQEGGRPLGSVQWRVYVTPTSASWVYEDAWFPAGPWRIPQ